MELDSNQLKRFFYYTNGKAEWVVRQTEFVDVRRRKDENGKISYVKTFLAGMEYWTERELCFLRYFVTPGTLLKCVVHPRHMSWDVNERVEQVETWDAGHSLDLWAGLYVRPVGRFGENDRRVFDDPVEILKLVRVCLLALREMEKHGIVHCDIKLDNICVPCKDDRDPLSPQGIRLDYTRLRLIDFAYSVRPSEPGWELKHCLPMQSDPVGAEQERAAAHFSPCLREVLRKDRQLAESGCLPRHWKELNYSVDLYALGRMLRGLLDGLPPEADSACPKAVSLLDELAEDWLERYAHGLPDDELADKKQHKPPRHWVYLGKVKSLLKDLEWESSAPLLPLGTGQVAPALPTAMPSNTLKFPVGSVEPTPVVKPPLPPAPPEPNPPPQILPPVYQPRGTQWQRWRAIAVALLSPRLCAIMRQRWLAIAAVVAVLSVIGYSALTGGSLLGL